MRYLIFLVFLTSCTVVLFEGSNSNTVSVEKGSGDVDVKPNKPTKPSRPSKPSKPSR